MIDDVVRHDCCLPVDLWSRHINATGAAKLRALCQLPAGCAPAKQPKRLVKSNRRCREKQGKRFFFEKEKQKTF
jgi:hypothetical protein